MASDLHEERLAGVVQALLASGATRILDLGCGSGELLSALRSHAQFTQLLGIDIDEHQLAEARAVLGLDLLAPDERLHVRYGSFEEADRRLRGFDAAVMLETIEHIEPSRLSKVEHMVFRGLQLSTVLITTPNQEYNVVHGMAPGERRHPGHRFEWTRAQFSAWASGVAERNDYLLEFSALGPPHPVYGSSTQMALFRRR
ncbi:methyltransferase domain-containing protein [Allohahella marinimesophila]|uniref:Small RNA 2'-O-methyltransferase n=1 Tax=Allohahella marinimesophila TaxID=1054972 RepID=A0ABP7P1Y8_9GAMM